MDGLVLLRRLWKMKRSLEYGLCIAMPSCSLLLIIPEASNFQLRYNTYFSAFILPRWLRQNTPFASSTYAATSVFLKSCLAVVSQVTTKSIALLGEAFHA